MTMMWADKSIAAKIQGEDDARIIFQAGHQRCVALRFAAEDEPGGHGIEEAPRRGQLRDAVVDPELERGMRVPQPRQHRIVVAGSFDRIEIRDVKRAEGKDRQQPSRHVKRIARPGKRRFDWPIKLALSHARAHGLPALQVNDWNDFHGHRDARYAGTSAVCTSRRRGSRMTVSSMRCSLPRHCVRVLSR
jgi:hypothetical protein